MSTHQQQTTTTAVSEGSADATKSARVGTTTTTILRGKQLAASNSKEIKRKTKEWNEKIKQDNVSKIDAAARGQKLEQLRSSSKQRHEKALSSSKRKISEVKQRKDQAAKRLKSPAGPMSPISPLIPARSPGIRMMLSSPRLETAGRSPLGSLHLIKRRKLTSEIWLDFEAIYDGGTVAEARCLHCNKILKVNRVVGTSACLRHMRKCEGKTRMNKILDQLNSGNLPLPEDWERLEI